MPLSMLVFFSFFLSSFVRLLNKFFIEKFLYILIYFDHVFPLFLFLPDPPPPPTHPTLCSFLFLLKTSKQTKSSKKSVKRKIKTNKIPKRFLKEAPTKQNEVKSPQKQHWVCFVLANFSQTWGLPWDAVVNVEEKTDQLQINSWLEMSAHVYLCFSALGPCLAWTCAILVDGATLSKSSYECQTAVSGRYCLLGSSIDS